MFHELSTCVARLPGLPRGKSVTPLYNIIQNKQKHQRQNISMAGKTWKYVKLMEKA